MDFLNTNDFINNTKLILTLIINKFLARYENNMEFREQIQIELKSYLKTQLYIIFDNSNLFNNTIESINIINPKRKKQLLIIRKFFVENNKNKMKKGINFILEDNIFQNIYSDFMSSEKNIRNNYDILYNNIQYNEKLLQFINKEFPKTISQEFSKILNDLSKYNEISKHYNISQIENNILKIKVFYELDDDNKKIYIINQKNKIDNEITKLMTLFSTQIYEDNIDDFDIDINSLKPSDISILTNENMNAEKVWKDLLKDDSIIKYDMNPNINFTHFIKLFDSLKNQSQMFLFDKKNLNFLISQTKEYINFIKEETNILSNIKYYQFNIDKTNKLQNMTKFLSYLQKMPENDKKLLNQIISQNNLIIKQLFDKINSNYEDGIKKCIDCTNKGFNLDIYKVKYYDENIKKLHISYNILFTYLNKCRLILEYKKQKDITSNNLLPIGITLSDSHKFIENTYSYICDNILNYWIDKSIINANITKQENYEGIYILELAYYKEFLNIKNILKDYSDYYEIINKTLNSKLFTKFINNLIKEQVEQFSKNISHESNFIKNIISNIDTDEETIKDISLTEKIQKKESKLYHESFLKTCDIDNKKTLYKKFISNNTSINTFIKNIDDKLIKKLFSEENKQNIHNIEWYLMMNTNRKLFIAYFSNMYEKIVNIFADNTENSLYSFDNFHSNNFDHNISLIDTTYTTLYEQNFDKWTKNIKYILPIDNFIERYIKIVDKYLDKDLYKIINNRIILLETIDEIKFYDNLKSSNDKEYFINLVMEKQIVTEILPTIQYNLKFFTNQEIFFKNLFNISFTDENLTKPIADYINKITKQIDSTQKYISSLEILIPHMDDLEQKNMTIQIQSKNKYVHNLKKIIKRVEILDSKYKTIDYDIENINYTNNIGNLYVNVNDSNYQDDDTENNENDGEYGETNEPDKEDTSNVNEDMIELNDFEQQSHVQIEDIINAQRYEKHNNIKRWINTIYMYLNINLNKFIIDKVIEISSNSEYKKTMDKNIHQTFAKYLKHDFLSITSYNSMQRIRYDKEITRLHRNFLLQIEFDVLKIISILHIIIYDIEPISKKKNICNSKNLLNFINDSIINKKEITLSNFVKIIDGRWKGHSGTVVTQYDNEKFIKNKKNIIENLRTTLILYKKLKKSFDKKDQNLIKNISKKEHILEMKKKIYHNNLLEQKNNQFLDNLDKMITNIENNISKNIKDLKNKEISITLDRFGTKGTKYIPHIKSLSILNKNIEFTKIDSKNITSSINNKFEEVKDIFTNDNTLFDITKCLFSVLEIFHPSIGNKIEFEEIFQKNYFIYIYNFAFNIFQKNRMFYKRELLYQLQGEYDIDNLTNKFNDTSLHPRLKRKLEEKLKQARIRKQLFEIEDNFSDIFETIVIKKTRKENITLFKNLYINAKGNILAEYEINAQKNVEIEEKKKDKLLIKNITNDFNKFENSINNIYSEDECNFIKLLNS